jgi:hypothetical protein
MKTEKLGLPWSATPYASIYSSSLDDNVAYVGLEYDDHGDEIRTDRDKAISDHIVHSCNQHDKLIELLKKFWHSVEYCQYGAQCPGCGKCVEHEPDCELTVLLKEEKVL